MRVLALATEDDMVLTFLRAEVDSPRFAGPLLLALGEQGLDRALVDRADRTDPRKMGPAGDCLPRIVATAGTRLSSPACRMTFPGHGWRSPPRSSPMSATSIGTTGSRSRAGPGDPGTRSRACAPTGTQRAATTAGSLWPPPAVPSPGARDSRTAARAGSGAAGRPRQIDRPPPRSSTSARRATRAARHVAANRGVGAVRVLREIP
jgi:hypothetical protein